MKLKFRFRNSKIEFTKRHGVSLLGTQFKYKEQLRNKFECLEAEREINNETI